MSRLSVCGSCLSDGGSTQDGMTDNENDARLRSLMAMLALPARRAPNGTWHRVVVQVEVSPGLWADVDSCIVEPERLTFCRENASCYTFLRSEGVPRWRLPDTSDPARLVVP